MFRQYKYSAMVAPDQFAADLHKQKMVSPYTRR
jgi:hypothetical protein